jgi:hypothetical protein
MAYKFREEEITEVKELLKQKHLKIPNKRIKEHLGKVLDSQEIFPHNNQRALLVRLLDNYDNTQKKEVIILEEPDDKKKPATFVLGVLAEDWPGMSNSILGIIHHKRRNVRFMKGFTLNFDGKNLGIVIMTFQLKNDDEYDTFVKNEKSLIREIKDAAQGSTSKYLLLDDEAVKFEIYNKILKKIREIYHNSELVKIIEESGEVLKFVSSRSREYLEDRNIKDLSMLILDNYVYQNMIKGGTTEEIVKIRNFQTNVEELTGITFVCKEHIFSIEDFLKTLNHIVPDHIIKHHKSYVTRDQILVYRLEILDRNGAPLNPKLNKSIETSLLKLISIACSKKFTKVKSVGGFEHYARAIIPFLSEELKRTELTQVFINMDTKTEFQIDLKLIIVAFKSRKIRNYPLISKLSSTPGIDIKSVIPPKVHGNKIEISLLKLKVNVSEFTSIKEIYNTIKAIVKKIYGDIRDFDEGFRDIYIRILNQLLDNLKTVDAALIREIFFNIDELYKIEIAPKVLLELIRACAAMVKEANQVSADQILMKHMQLPESHRSVLVVSYVTQKRVLSRIVQKMNDVKLYFTRIEWNQRFYLLMILSKENEALDDTTLNKIKDQVRHCGKENIKEC